MPLPRYYKTTIYTDEQRQLLWLYAENEGTKWVKGFEVIAANTVNKDYCERLLKEKNENGIGLHGDDIEEIEKKKGNQSDGKITKSDKQKKSATKADQKRRGEYYVPILISRVLSFLE